MNWSFKSSSPEKKSLLLVNTLDLPWRFEKNPSIIFENRRLDWEYHFFEFVFPWQKTFSKDHLALKLLCQVWITKMFKIFLCWWILWWLRKGGIGMCSSLCWMIIALKFKFHLVFSYKLFKRMNECNLTLFDLQLNAKCLCISFLRGRWRFL